MWRRLAFTFLLGRAPRAPAQLFTSPPPIKRRKLPTRDVMVPVDSGLAALMIWTAAAFGLGFAAGWIAKRRTVHRKAKRVGMP
jgi:hypothetical protein